MAAVLTLGTVAVAAGGKTVTATISGGTGTGYAITDATGILVHLSTLNQYPFPIASVSVAGTTLTINLSVPVGSTETVQLNITAGSNLTDSGANTPTGQTNVAITNNSTVTVTIFDPSQAVFELNGTFLVTTTGNGSQIRNTGWFVSSDTEWPVEFITDATEVGVMCQGNQTATVRIDGATGNTTMPADATQTWNIKPATTSPLAAGKHLFLVNFGDFFWGVRLSGGTRTMYAVPTAKRTILNNTGVAGYPTSSAEITNYGCFKANVVANGDVSAGQFYCGHTMDFQFTGTGVELATVRHNNSYYAALVDGGFEGALIQGGDATIFNSNGYSPIVWGRTPGAHTIHLTQLALGSTTGNRALRIINGTKLAALSSIGDGTLSVSDTTYLAVNDWVRIDQYSKREWRQITNITGSGPYTLTLNANLAIAHAAGVQVTSYAAAAGTFTAWKLKDLSGKRWVVMGDSNSQGANDLGGLGTPDANGTYYVTYDPRTPGVYQVCQSLNYELVNLGIQGQTSTQMAARAADIGTYGRGPVDGVYIFAGTNDINGTANTPATFNTNVQTIITAAAAQLKPGGKIVLMPVGTPSGTTNGGGLSVATANAQLVLLAAANPTTCLYAPFMQDNVTAGDRNGVHYHDTGQRKIGQGLLPHTNPAITTMAAA